MPENSSRAHRPATFIPPPLVYAAVLLLAWYLNKHWPWPLELGEVGVYLAWLLIGLGLLGFSWALFSIWQHKTTVNPFKGASHLITTGPFAYSRNPIYVSDWLVYAGVMLLLHSVWPLVFVPVVWAIMRYGVILHEEAHLQAKFGDAYTEYRARVRRWL